MANPGSENEFVFLPLGGAGEIGMNLNCYGYGPPDARKWIVIDCGVLFGREAATPGIDLIMPDIRFLMENRSDLLGIVLTHAHEDHLGAVAHLWPMLRCPVYATPFTARILAGKLEEAGLEDRLQPKIVPLGGALQLGPFALELLTLTHSIPEPNAIAIRTKLGTVMHTGDWKIDPDPLIGEPTDVEAFRKVGMEGVLAMVCDSTNALVEGQSGSEADVRRSLVELIGTLKGRVAVTGFASNVARLQSVAHAARVHGRSLVLVGRSMRRFVEAARETGYLDSFPPVMQEEDASSLSAEKVLYLCTGSQGEPRAALARIAAGENPNVRLDEGDTVIFSSRIIPGNETAIFELHNKLAALGVTVLTEKDHFVHVSGHPAREELAEMYRWVRPHISIPVHGELRHMKEHARIAKALQVPQAIIAMNGQMVRLAPGRAAIVDEAPSGRLYLDGRILLKEDSGVVRSRRALAFAGFIGVTLVLNHKGRLAADPVILWEGVPDEIHEPVMDAIDKASAKHNGDVAEAVRRAARRAAQDAWGKKPIVRVEIVEV